MSVGRRSYIPVLLCLVWVGTTLLLARDPALAQDPGSQVAAATAEPFTTAQESSRQAAVLAQHADYSLVLERAPQVVEMLDKANRFLDWAASATERSKNNPTPSTRQDAEVLARRASKSFEAYRQAVEEQLKAIDLERNPPPPPPPPPTESSPPPPVGSSPPPPPSGPPRALRRAAEAYLAGDYEEVVELTSKGAVSGRKAKARAAMLRAAARYALFLLGGESDYALRGQATADVLECRKMDSQLKPPAEVFSPRFRDFFLATQ